MNVSFILRGKWRAEFHALDNVVFQFDFVPSAGDDIFLFDADLRRRMEDITIRFCEESQRRINSLFNNGFILCANVKKRNFHGDQIDLEITKL